MIGSVPSGDQIRNPFSEAFELISGINLNLQILALECSREHYTYFDYLKIKMLLPFCVSVAWMTCGVCILLDRAGVMIWRKRGITVSHFIYAAVSTSSLLLTQLYLVVTTAVMSYMSCIQLINGPWVLDSSPDVVCFGNDHLEQVWVFVIGVVFYVIGIPAGLWVMVVHKRHSLLKINGKLPSWYTYGFGFLSKRYHDNVYWCVRFWRQIISHEIGGSWWLCYARLS